MVSDVNTSVNTKNNQVPLSYVSIREEFKEWLTRGITIVYSPEVVLTSLDRISDYAIFKKISVKSLWDYTNLKEFKLINRLIEEKLNQTGLIKKKNELLVACQLYLNFLKEKPLSNNEIESSQSAINQESIIAWLITQPNSNGSLFLENVVRQYMNALRTTPEKLDLPIDMKIKNVFICKTPEELTTYWDVFKTAPNYKQVNISTSGSFSAGMSCFLKYLKHLTGKSDDKKENPNVSQLIEYFDLEYVDKRDIGGALWIIGGLEISSAMLELGNSGFSFTFKAGGGRSTDNRDAWWYKPNNNLTEIKSNDLISQKLFSEINIDERIDEILTNHFANGYRLNSPIELARFKAFAVEDFAQDILLSDEELIKQIISSGILHDGKLYAVPEDVKKRIKEEVNRYFAEGNYVIFYDEFYIKNESWLFKSSVVSEKMLIDMLRLLFPKLLFSLSFFGCTDTPVASVLEKEILRVWEADVLLNFTQLAQRLKYIPIERIKQALCLNNDFIWSSKETYTHINKIDITSEEKKVIRETALKKCNERGYVTINDLPFGDIEHRNYGLSESAVDEAVFRICLPDNFDKHGKIIVRKGDSLDSFTILKNYCRTIEKCSLSDLIKYGEELTGEDCRWNFMEAGYAVLVRIDKDAFVADKYVHFDIDAIDEAIDIFIDGEYLPLKSFTAFGAFPHCGQKWNLYLLESYCRRFSNRFRFDTSSINSRNAGAVIRKSCGMSYTDIMTDAVINAEIPLSASSVDEFLFDSGYTGRSTSVKVNKIINMAKAIRDRRA